MLRPRDRALSWVSSVSLTSSHPGALDNTIARPPGRKEEGFSGLQRARQSTADVKPSGPCEGCYPARRIETGRSAARLEEEVMDAATCSRQRIGRGYSGWQMADGSGGRYEDVLVAAHSSITKCLRDEMAPMLHGWWSYCAISARVTGGWAAQRSAAHEHTSHPCHARRETRHVLLGACRCNTHKRSHRARPLRRPKARPDWANSMIASACP